MTPCLQEFSALAAKHDIPITEARPGTLLEVISLRASGPGWLIHRRKLSGTWALFNEHGFLIGEYRDLADLFVANIKRLSPFS